MLALAILSVLSLMGYQ
ncbi:hypothetical protein LXA44_17735, partial [Erwinia amylovora]|nr:hypothetical protein [Erwinia amylovora]